MRADEVKEYEKALGVCEKMLAFEMDSLQKSNIQRKMGDIYLEIAKLERSKASCSRALHAYQKALEVYSAERYPSNRARAVRSLGFAYMAMSDMEDRAGNLEHAIDAWEKALRFFTLASFPFDYASLQNELGSAYRRLAEHKSRLENGRRAVNGLQRIPQDLQPQRQSPAICGCQCQPGQCLSDNSRGRRSVG